MTTDFVALSGDTQRKILRLRKQGIGAETASGIAELHDARIRASRRFPNANKLFWTGESVAQATSPMLAAYHAARLAPMGTVADLGCSVGIDSIALAMQGVNVIAVELDPVRLWFARVNAERCGVSDRITFLQDDVTALNWAANAVYWDPSRRENGRRVSADGESYTPPLSFLSMIREKVGNGCVKLSPALPDAVLESLKGRVEFLSEAYECKEVCVCFGDVFRTMDSAFRAVLLPDIQEFTAAEPAPIAESFGAYLFDPDPAILRAGALGDLCRRSDLALMTFDDAYLTGATICDRRFARAYRISEILPFQPKRILERLTAQDVGNVVVKKRHYAGDSDSILKEIGFKKGGGREMTLVLVRLGKGFLAVFCEPVV